MMMMMMMMKAQGIPSVPKRPSRSQGFLHWFGVWPKSPPCVIQCRDLEVEKKLIKSIPRKCRESSALLRVEDTSENLALLMFNSWRMPFLTMLDLYIYIEIKKNIYYIYIYIHLNFTSSIAAVERFRWDFAGKLRELPREMYIAWNMNLPIRGLSHSTRVGVSSHQLDVGNGYKPSPRCWSEGNWLW